MASLDADEDISPRDDGQINFSCSEVWGDQSLYEILEVAASATSDEIKASLRRLVKSAHPDKCEEYDASKFIRLLEAYKTLSDESLRTKYDFYLKNKLREKSNHTQLPHRMSSPVVKASVDSVEVEWSVEDENEEQYIDAFMLELKKNGFGIQQAYEGSSRCVRILELTKGWSYQVRVRSVNNMGAGEVSNWRTFVVPLSSDEDAQSPRTQHFINDLHVAISTRNTGAIETLLDQADAFDLKHFESLRSLAIATVTHSQAPPHASQSPRIIQRASIARKYVPAPSTSPSFSPRAQKSLL